jgi:phage shock protein A
MTMGLFQRLNRVLRAEINYAKTQSINSVEEINRAISMLQDAVIKTRLEIVAAPAEHADILKRNLIDLETELTDAQVKRDKLVTRISKPKP